jgi:RND superfamily putative drug exporter
VFARLASFVARHPWKVIAVWLVLGIVLAAVGQAKLYDVTTDDQTEFIPSASESAQAERFAQQAFGRAEGATGVTVLVKRAHGADGPTDADVAALTAEMRGEDRIVAAETGPAAPGGRFRLVALQFEGNSAEPGCRRTSGASATGRRRSLGPTGSRWASPAAWPRAPTRPRPTRTPRRSRVPCSWARSSCSCCSSSAGCWPR